MFRSIQLISQLIRYKPNQPDNADLIAKVVLHFTGNSIDHQIELWSKTDTGQRYLAGERIIDNIESFRNRDENTLGHQYLLFMDKFYFDKLGEILDLNKNGKVGNDIKQKYGLFIMDCHDFLHVITGYPPTPHGELMRIKIYKQYEGRGWGVVDTVGKLWAYSKGIKEAKRYRELAQEARQTRKLVTNYIFEDWFEMLGWHINKVRKNLSTKSTTLYDYKNL